MQRRTIAIAAGALIIVGGAAAIAAVGHREGRHRGMMHEMGEFGPRFAQGSGHEHGEGRGGRGMRGHRGEMGEDGGRGGDMGMRGMRRGMSGDDFDARTRERFARIDRNSDGVIDTAEVEAGGDV